MSRYSQQSLAGFLNQYVPRFLIILFGSLLLIATRTLPAVELESSAKLAIKSPRKLSAKLIANVSAKIVHFSQVALKQPGFQAGYIDNIWSEKTEQDSWIKVESLERVRRYIQEN